MANQHFPSPADDGDNVVFRLTQTVKAIGPRWLVELEFGEGAILDEPVGEYVKGLFIDVYIDDDAHPFFVELESEAADALNELQEKFNHAEAIVSSEFLENVCRIRN